MSMRESLVQAMHLPPDSDTFLWLQDHGVAIADQETMSRAIHDVYCGATADHDHPNEKDHQQAAALLVAMHKASTAG
jgi:hypothetical protein